MFDGAIFATPQQRALRRAYDVLVQRYESLDRAAAPDDCGAQKELERVRTALSWFVVGAYGRCCVCGVELQIEQIECDPADMACHDCKGAARVPGACLR